MLLRHNKEMFYFLLFELILSESELIWNLIMPQGAHRWPGEGGQAVEEPDRGAGGEQRKALH